MTTTFGKPSFSFAPTGVGSADGKRYPASPAQRILYDVNGSIMIRTSSGGTTTDISNLMALMNSLATTNTHSISNDAYIAVVFPAAFDLTAFYTYFESSFGSNNSPVLVSTDTSNGIDGTWTTWVPAPAGGTKPRAGYRTAIIKPASPAPGARGIRFATGSFGGSNGAGAHQFWAIHLYGQPSAPYGLEFWSPTSDTSLLPNYLDLGDVARNVSAPITKTLRLKNRSTMTANAPVVTLQAVSDATPTVLSQMTLVDNTGAAVSSLTLPDLAPGAISSTFSVRLSPAANMAISQWEQRIVADATSWS